MSARRHHRARSRGLSFAMLNFYVAAFLALLLAGGLLVGRTATQKYEQQAQADAVSRAAIMLAMRQGGGEELCNREAIQVMQHLAVHNNKGRNINVTCEKVERENPDGTRYVEFAVTVDGEMEDTGFNLYDGERGMGTRAVARVDQGNFGDPSEFRYPKLVLVLDYSGSMRADFGGQSRIQALREAVNDLLDLGLLVDYGLVMYNSGVIDTVNLNENNRIQRIRDAISGRGAGGGTNYDAPLNRARNMLRNQEDTGYNILLISDGIPNDEGAARNAARDVKRDGITLFTLLVGPRGGPENLLIDLAGENPNRGSRDHAFRAGNRQELQDTFRRIVADVLCTLGPLEPRPPNGLDPRNGVFALMRDRGVEGAEETPLQYTLDIANSPDDGFQYIADEAKIRLTESACMKMIEQNKEVIIRYGYPRLVQ